MAPPSRHRPAEAVPRYGFSTQVYIRSVIAHPGEEYGQAELRRRVLLHLAAPRARCLALGLDQLLEALEVAADAALRDAEGVAGGFDDSVGVDVHLDHDAGLVLVGLVEGHDAGLLSPARAAPRDALVGRLLGHLGVELLALAA